MQKKQLRFRRETHKNALHSMPVVNKLEIKVPNVQVGINELENFLLKHYKMRRNLVTGQVECYNISKPEDGIRDFSKIYANSIVRAGESMGIKLKRKEIEDLVMSDFIKEYDPFIEFAELLPPWKEGDFDYLDALGNTVEIAEENRAYFKKCLKKWFVAAIGCAVDTKVVNHTILVFTGAQASGKTTWLSFLMPKSLEKYYFCGSINASNKDSKTQIFETLIVNFDEIGSSIEKNNDDFKSLITAASVRLRKPYTPDHFTFYKRCSFVGSTNKYQFLPDKTGNRRVLAFEVGILTLPNFQIDLVWSQAYHLLKSGYKYWFDQEETQELNHHNDAYVVRSIEEEHLLPVFRPCNENEIPDFSFRTTEVRSYLIQHYGMPTSCSVHRLGIVLQANGFRRRRSSGDRLYNLKLLANDVINNDVINNDGINNIELKESINNETNYPKNLNNQAHEQ